MRYCTRCVLPDTRPNLVLDAAGVCNACRSHAHKPDIDWPAREAALRRIVAASQAKSRGYDCIVPVSGGKDSHWQIIKCLDYGLNPLAVTWKTPGRTALGSANLANLVSLGVDHIDYQVNPKVERRFMLQALERFGSTAIPMHMALFAIPLTIAVRFAIPLVVFGENSASEYGALDPELTGFRLDAAWLAAYGVTHGTRAADWVSETLSVKDLTPYFAPSDAELEAAGVSAVFLGAFLPWDPQRVRETAAAKGFRARPEGPRTGYYDFADIDDAFIAVHHWLKWYKFGFTRLFDNLSLEIRNGRLTREQALGIIRDAGEQRPVADIERLCAFCEIPPRRFYEIAETFRNPAIWERSGGVWRIRDFLIPDWSWS